MDEESDAVKAVSLIDESDSIAQQDFDGLGVDFGLSDVQTVNMVAHMDGALTDAVIERADIDDELADAYLTMGEGSLWDDFEFNSEDIDAQELIQAADEKSFAEEEIQVFLEMQDRMQDSIDASALEAELVMDGNGEIAQQVPTTNTFTVATAVAAVAVVVVVALAIDTTP